jgi:D-lactate dehydrogenase (cytochrome)
VAIDDVDAALRLVADLRRDARQLCLSGIEHMDARCLSLLREDGVERRAGVAFPQQARIGLLVTFELPPAVTAEDAFDQIGRAGEPTMAQSPLARFCRTLQAAGLFDRAEIAVPGDVTRAAQLSAIREAVPAAVNARIAIAQRTIDPRISKTAADMIVPFSRLGELMALYDREFQERGLDAAIWGHISDGNLHPNVLPRSFADVVSGREAVLSFGQSVLEMGGSPLAEHGVGRNPIKHQLLQAMYGDHGIEEMRAVKRALDPEWKLAPGVLFTPAR